VAGLGPVAWPSDPILDWFAGVRPGEPVLRCSQTANERSMRLAAKLGFNEVERFEELGAEQWLGAWCSAPVGRT